MADFELKVTTDLEPEDDKGINMVADVGKNMCFVCFNAMWGLGSSIYVPDGYSGNLPTSVTVDVYGWDLEPNQEKPIFVQTASAIVTFKGPWRKKLGVASGSKLKASDMEVLY